MKIIRMGILENKEVRDHLYISINEFRYGDNLSLRSNPMIFQYYQEYKNLPESEKEHSKFHALMKAMYLKKEDIDELSKKLDEQYQGKTPEQLAQMKKEDENILRKRGNYNEEDFKRLKLLESYEKINWDILRGKFNVADLRIQGYSDQEVGEIIKETLKKQGYTEQEIEKMVNNGMNNKPIMEGVNKPKENYDMVSTYQEMQQNFPNKPNIIYQSYQKLPKEEDLFEEDISQEQNNQQIYIAKQSTQ